MKRISSIVLAFALAATAAQAEIMQIITADGETRYIDTNAGVAVSETANAARESHLADSTIGFATRPEVAPNPTPSNPGVSTCQKQADHGCVPGRWVQNGPDSLVFIED